MLWDAESRKLIWTTKASPPSLHGGTLEFSPDGESLYIGEARGGEVRKLDRGTGERILSWTATKGQAITAMAVSADGALATAQSFESGTIKIWDPSNGQLTATLAGHTSWVPWLEFNAAGDTLVSAGADQTIRFWNIKSGEERFNLRGHRDEVYALSISPKGDRMVSGGKDGAVSLWDFKVPQREPHYRARPIETDSIIASQDGQHLFVYTKARELIELDPQTLEDIGKAVEFGVRKLAIPSVDSPLLAISSFAPTGPAEIWNLETRTITKKLDLEGPIFFYGQGKVAVIDFNGQPLTGVPPETISYSIYDTTTWEKIGYYPKQDLRSQPYTSPNLEYLAVNGEDGTVLLAQLASNSQIKQIAELSGHRRPTSAIAFSPDNTIIATVSLSGYGYLWETKTGMQLASLHGHLKGIHGVVFSPDSRRVVTSSNEPDTIKLWDTRSFREVLTINSEGTFFSNLIMTGDNKTILATSRRSGKIYLNKWTAPTWEEIEASKTE
jgi:WD40 repeat protein